MVEVPEKVMEMDTIIIIYNLEACNPKRKEIKTTFRIMDNIVTSSTDYTNNYCNSNCLDQQLL